MLSPIASVDGYGVSDERALEESLWVAAIDEAKRSEIAGEERALRESTNWGTGLSASEHIVDCIVEMISRGASCRLGNKRDIHWGEIESISEAVCEACIILGLDEDSFSPSIVLDGFEYEVSLY